MGKVQAPFTTAPAKAWKDVPFGHPAVSRKTPEGKPVSFRGFLGEDVQGMFDDETKHKPYWLKQRDWPYDDEGGTNAYATQENHEMKQLIEGGQYSDLGLQLEPHLKTKKRRLFSLDETDLINQSHSSDVSLFPFLFSKAS